MEKQHPHLHLFTEYFPDMNLNSVDEARARELIVEQHIASFGPVTEKDASWWTGFPKRQVAQIIQNLEDKIIRIEVSNMKEGFLLLSSHRNSLLSTKPREDSIISILPGLDPYLMGYKDRDRYVNHEHYNFVFDRSGNATSTILLDGQVIGIWDVEEPFVKIFLFNIVKSNILREIHSKARTAGAVMSPLKAMQ